MLKTKQDLIRWLEENTARFTAISDDIWYHPELAWREFRAARLQADFLQAEGFTITRRLAGISTAFLAEWGEGRPIIGFIGEYDALAGLSQKAVPYPQALEEGGAGHGCGHNLLGVGCLAAAVAVKHWLEANDVSGTVRYYGCPAEEQGGAKTYIARDGLFTDLDAAFNFHPAHLNTAMKGRDVGVIGLRFRFHGRTSHAGATPHLGRSALDAVELMNVGVNYLREHVPEKVRMHYVITRGGEAPNIVPDEAEVWYFLRAPEMDMLYEVEQRVRKVAEGAALMTETHVEVIFDDACAPLINNHQLADLQYEAMQLVGPLHFTEEEIAFAKQINDWYPPGTMDEVAKNMLLPRAYYGQHLLGENFPSLDENEVYTGSTDVGDLSRVAPVSMLLTACWPAGAPGHTWGVVATGAMSIGHKGMMHAAKIMALTALELYTQPQRLQAVRQEFEQRVLAQPYKSPIPDHIHPPQYDQQEVNHG